MNLFIVWQVYIQLKSDNHNRMYIIQRSGGWYEKMSQDLFDSASESEKTY